jgi:hypothetical protein
MSKFCENATNLFLLNKVRDMRFVLALRNVSPPTRHEVNILDVSFLPFELEVAVNSDKQRIKEPVGMYDKDQQKGNTENKSTIGPQRFPNRPEDFDQGEDMPDIRQLTPLWMWHRCPLVHDPDQLA